MKQLIQHLQSGKTTLEEVPIPAVKNGYIVVRSIYSLVSTGTEKMLVEFSKASIINKVRQNPDRVEQVLNKISSDGLIPTLDAVFRKLEEPMPLGYCNLGVVTAVGEGVNDFKIGDRVISNGPHAEYVAVPKNLACKVPHEVSNEAAVFTVVGAIGLEAIRLAKPQLGDTVCVIGLGLIGLLTCQLLRASGCNVMAYDIDDKKIAIAKSMQIAAFNSSNIDIDAHVLEQTNNFGCDVVFIAASAKNDNLVNIAARATKKRGQVILIGVINLQLDRTEFYKKEITFQVSCSYGAGRYDDQYEIQGIDYPEAYVKWTAKRNFEAFLSCLNNNTVQTTQLITSTILFEQAPEAYAEIAAPDTVALLLKYANDYKLTAQPEQVTIKPNKPSAVTVGIIGSGNFAKATLVPILQKIGANIKYICGNDGLSAALLAKKFNIPHAVTSTDTIINDPEVNLLIIATRHDSHAALAIAGLNANKHIFVEKPIAIDLNSLEQLKAAHAQHPELIFQSGFNRRHAPLAKQLKAHIQNNPVSNIVITVNAGALPDGHWLYNKTTGGGRIVGEACHFFDLMSYFTGSTIKSVYATEAPISNQQENTIIHLTYHNGSHGTINYFANGHKKYPKEKIEVFAGNKIFMLDNFRKLYAYGANISNSLFSTQDKGHKAQFETLLQSLHSDQLSSSTFESLYNTTKATLLVEKSITTKAPQEVD
ncbi:MAG: bi-domain-containing oxidoreductase [Bacteroidetes bacterium]|nr:bi-domain-containing oxidoreductase [Bacteroidota bacterium]